MKNFCQKLCCCFKCFESWGKTSIPLVEEPICEMRNTTERPLEGEEGIFPKKWYTPSEEGKIIFTKQSILDLFKELNDPKKDEEFKQFYFKDGMKLESNDKGTIFTSKVPLIRFSYSFPKTDLKEGTTPEIIGRYMTDEVDRPKWDDGFNQYKLVEKYGESKLLYSWNKSPIFLISERDTLDKNIDFMHEGQFFSFSTSVNDDLYPMNESVIRIADFLTLHNVSQDENSFYVTSLTQIDIKMAVPPNILNGLLPMKIVGWYKKLKQAINDDVANK